MAQSKPIGAPWFGDDAQTAGFPVTRRDDGVAPGRSPSYWPKYSPSKPLGRGRLVAHDVFDRRQHIGCHLGFVFQRGQIVRQLRDP